MAEKKPASRQALQDHAYYERISAELTQHYTEMLHQLHGSEDPALILTAPMEHYESLLPQGITPDMATEVRRVDAIFKAALQRAALNVSKDPIWKADGKPKRLLVFKAAVDRDLSGGRYDPMYTPPHATVTAMSHIAEGVAVSPAQIVEKCRDFDSAVWYSRCQFDTSEMIQRLCKTPFNGKVKE